MGISILPNRFQFNGVISTDQTVLQNLEMMCRAAGSWLTYDSNRGQWAVIINRAGTSVRSFNDSNIIGSINLTSTGFMDLYNSVRVTFPHQDLNDVRDFVRYAIPVEDRFPGEPDNELLIEYDIFNDPVQADILAITELKQSRKDLVITFSTNFNSIGLRAGDIVDVTSDMYGFDQRKFRIINVVESDTEDGNIVLDITALEYDDSVYDLSDLFRFERSDLNGIGTPGDLGAPSTPELQIAELDSRPRVIITALVPGNAIVERMEFWYSTNNLNFERVGTVTPEDGSGSFAVGSPVSFEFVPPVNGNMHYRVRAGNSTAVGPFSPTKSDTFTPIQVPDAIDEQTALIQNGLLLSLLLGLPDLLKGLDTFLGGSTNTFNQVQITETAFLSVEAATVITKLNAMTATSDADDIYDASVNQNKNNWIAASIQVPAGIDILEFDLNTPTVFFNYKYRDQNDVLRTAQNFIAQPPLQLSLYYGDNLDTAVEAATSTIDWNNNAQKLIINGPGAGRWWIVGRAIPTYDLNMYWVRANLPPPGEPNLIYPTAYQQASPSPAGDFKVTVRAIQGGLA
jgi:hypothetical protein